MLARYVGWGGMPNVFGYTPPGEWRTTAAAVKELLTLRGPVTVGVFQVFNYSFPGPARAPGRRDALE